jgi:hypothetical protein
VVARVIGAAEAIELKLTFNEAIRLKIRNEVKNLLINDLSLPRWERLRKLILTGIKYQLSGGYETARHFTSERLVETPVRSIDESFKTPSKSVGLRAIIDVLVITDLIKFVPALSEYHPQVSCKCLQAF